MSEFYKTIIDPKGKFGIWGIVVLVLLGVALLVIPGLFINTEKPAVDPGEITEKAFVAVNTLPQLEASLAQQIGHILNQVEGAGNVAVSVALEAGFEQEFVKNIASDSSTVQERDNAGGTRTTTSSNQKTEVVFAQNRGEALVAKELGPKIRGVLVVAEGASDSDIKLKLSHAVQAMLNVPAHRVMVLSKESG